jgi:hypothetical protein
MLKECLNSTRQQASGLTQSGNDSQQEERTQRNAGQTPTPAAAGLAFLPFYRSHRHTHILTGWSFTQLTSLRPPGQG